MSIKHTDVVILGAGPAGLTAALRLRQLGHDVTVLEHQAFPRPNVGESLTPGIRNILDYLDADSVLEHVPLRPSRVRLIWNSQEAHTTDQGAPSVMVNRGSFDQQLLRLASERGAICLQQAQSGQIHGQPDTWRLDVAHQGQTHTLHTRWILDARGRQAPATGRIATAPPLLAVWAECDEPPQPCTCVEALPGGWLWGAPLPGQGYRIMACGHPRDIHQYAPGQPARWLRDLLADSRLLTGLAGRPFRRALQACAATPYLAGDAWQAGQLKLGDAAFALDPLSSSGVEKAMRFSLQAVTALHTALTRPEHIGVAEQFYRERLQYGVLRHQHWSAHYYAEAWPGQTHAFWRQRSQPHPLPADAMSLIPPATEPAEPAPLAPARLAALLSHPVRLSAGIDYVQALCVVDDMVQSRRALTHPGLARPVAYVEGQDITALVQQMPDIVHLDTLVNHWTRSMPRQTATRITSWLCQQGLLEVAMP